MFVGGFILGVVFLCLFARPCRAGSLCDAKDFGVAGDGKKDDTAALQKGLDACAESGGGVLHVGPGIYAVHGLLNVPDNVTLQGVFNGPPAAKGDHHRDYSFDKGTTLYAYEGRGQESGSPFITLNANSTLRGVTVYYPEQDGDPTPYPWCVASGGGDNVSIIDCTLVNPYQGIDFASKNSSRHFVSRLYGSPLRRGIFVDHCTDIGRIEHVHFWPFYHGVFKYPSVRAFIQENAEAFIFGRTDWQHVFNTFSWGYKIGYRFANTKQGVCNGNFIGIGADASNVCVQVDNCAPYAVLITNGEFVSIFGEDPTGIVVEPTNMGTIQLNNCSFWGHTHQNARIEGRGHVSFNQCHFIEWDRYGRGAASIEARSGLLAVNACRFASPGLAVEVGREVKGAAVTGNLFGGENAVRVEDGARAAIHGNVECLPTYDNPNGSRVIGVLGHHVSVVGEWANISGRGSFTDFCYIARGGDGTHQFRWDLEASANGSYTLAAWVGEDPSERHAERQRYTVYHCDGQTTVEVDQKAQRGTWVPLGRFRCDEHSYVVLDNGAKGFVTADALLLTKGS